MSSKSPRQQYVEKPECVCPVPNCNLTVDVIIKSSDGILFGAHGVNLTAHSDGFPPTCFASPEGTKDPVELRESSCVVEHLLNYMHNHRVTALEGLSVAEINDVAHAAEKYFIYSLMEVCRLHMKYRFLKTNHMLVLAYAAKNGYNDLFDEAMPKTLDCPLEVVYLRLGASSHFIAWVRYRERLLQIRDTLEVDPPIVYHSGGRPDCADWTEFVTRLRNSDASKQLDWRTCMARLKDTYLKDCNWCTQRANQWMQRISSDIPGDVLKPSSLM